MKVSSSIRKMCKRCCIIRRNGKLIVICIIKEHWQREK